MAHMPSFESSPYGDFRDITLAEIRRYVEEENTTKAVQFARHRLEGIKDVPAEINKAIEEAGDIKPELWQEERDALVAEIAELQAIIARYQH